MDQKNNLEEGVEVRIDFNKLRKLVEKVKTDVVPVVVQDFLTKEVLIVAYVSQEALTYSLKSGVATFWSTSRNKLWIKGVTSGSTLKLVEVRVNCEQNSLLYLVQLAQGACHTKNADGKYRKSCYYRKLSDDGQSLAFVKN